MLLHRLPEASIGKEFLMTITIGIPRALIYYKEAPFWQAFFEKLGAKVLISEPTNSKILEKGLGAASSEVCLPVKAFFGHSLQLERRCDLVFIPRIVSVERDSYTCPKLLGLPDMLKALPDAPKILSANFDAKKKRRYYYKSLLDVASPITKNPLAVHGAYKAAVDAQTQFKAAQLEGGLIDDIMENNTRRKKKDSELTNGLVGHPYNIFDSHLSLNFLERLRRQNINVVTAESVGHEDIEKQLSSLPKAIYWSYEKQIVGSAMHWLNSKIVDGIVYLLAFACGPDSMIQVLLEDEASKARQTPLMSVVLDEHSGEAGIVTRLEAFLDMIQYKKMKVST